jgi:hypothetical protein
MNTLVRFAMVAFFPPEAGLPGLRELGVDDKIARLRRESTPLFWVGLVAASVIFQITPILTVHRPWPAALLSEEELDRHANALALHPSYLLRQLTVLLKVMAGILWGESREIRASIGLPAYGDDPGTRRFHEDLVPRIPLPRAPVEPLVELGRREAARGRSTAPGNE